MLLSCSFLIYSTSNVQNKIPILVVLVLVNSILLYIQFYLLYSSKNTTTTIDYFGQSAGITNIEQIEEQAKQTYLNDALGFTNGNEDYLKSKQYRDRSLAYQHNQNAFFENMNGFKTSPHPELTETSPFPTTSQQQTYGIDSIIGSGGRASILRGSGSGNGMVIGSS
jgi:predicted ferric reductase